MIEQVVRGPLLVPRDIGGVEYFPDGVLAGHGRKGNLAFAGAWAEFERQLPVDGGPPARRSDGVMMPPLLDIHTHIPQHPIRGHFTDGVDADDPAGRLLAGLKRNVFPAEMRCDDPAVAEKVTRDFLRDTLAHGVVGGAAYMTTSALATEVALSVLPDTWSVGLVLMNQNCPAGYCTREDTLDADVARLAGKFGKRLIITDRFAVAVDTPLRRRAAALAERFGLRTQTHLDEQVAEKAFVEKALYPGYKSYAEVYRRDGLLENDCIAAHCVHVRDDEWEILVDEVVTVAHCPTSNLKLGSGVMPLCDVLDRGLQYALGTDVGASPTVSMLAEMRRFLDVHRGHCDRATPSEAMFRSSQSPAEYLELGRKLGTLDAGEPMSFVEVRATGDLAAATTADDAILAILPADADAPEKTVRRVTMGGQAVFEAGRAKDEKHA